MEAETVKLVGVAAQVWHVKDVDAVDGRSLLSQIAHGECEISFPGNYEIVADLVTRVNSDAGDLKGAVLEQAFELTNNIDSSWVYHTEGAIPRAMTEHGNIARRSTSVGDVVIVDGKAYICAPMGWKDVKTERQPEQYIPPAGSWAAVAGMMAGIEPNFDWDGWKDEMKEQDA